MHETRLLGELKKAQSAYALEALRRPVDRNEFEYGHRTGYIAGLERAIEVLLALLDDEKNGNNDL